MAFPNRCQSAATAPMDRLTSSIHCAAAADVDRKLENMVHNVVDSLGTRLDILERQNLNQRINLLNHRLRPYEDYRTLVGEQTNKLRQVEAAVRTRQANVGMSVKNRVDKQEAAIRSLTQKLDHLQKQIESEAAPKADSDNGQSQSALLSSTVAEIESPTAASSTDTDAIATEFLERLRNGGKVHTELARQIRLALTTRHDSVSPESSGSEARAVRPGRANPGRLVRGPKGDRHARRASSSGESKQAIERNGRSSSEEIAVSSPISTPTAKRRQLVQRSKGTGSGRKSGSFKVPAWEVNMLQKDEDVSMVDKDDEENNDPPSISGGRRSTRAPQPRQFDPDMVHWREANPILKSMRPRGPGSSL